MSNTVLIRLTAHNNFALPFPKDALKTIFPNSLLGKAVDLDPKLTELDISVKVVTPPILYELQQIYVNGRYVPEPYGEAAAYLNLPILKVLHDPKCQEMFSDFRDGIPVTDANLFMYEHAMDQAIMNKSNNLVDYLVEVFPESSILKYHEETLPTRDEGDDTTHDQRLLALAIIRDNVYAAKALIKEHHVDPLTARFNEDLEDEHCTFQYDREHTNFGNIELCELSEKYPKMAVWYYLGYMMKIDPPSSEMIDLIFEHASDTSQAYRIFDYQYGHDRNQGFNSDRVIEYILDMYLIPSMTSEQLDNVFEHLVTDQGRRIESRILWSLQRSGCISDNTKRQIDLLIALMYDNGNIRSLLAGTILTPALRLAFDKNPGYPGNLLESFM